MARMNWNDDPVYAEAAKRLEPLKDEVAKARKNAEQMVADAKARVERETLDVVRWALENGLTQYAIGKLTGKTRAEHQRELIERAMGHTYMPLLVREQPTADDPEDVEPEVPVAYPDGWEFGAVDGDPNDGAVVIFSNAAGELFRCRVEDGLRRYYDELDGHPLVGDESFDRVPYEVDVWLYWLLYGEAPIGYMP